MTTDFRLRRRGRGKSEIISLYVCANIVWVSLLLLLLLLSSQLAQCMVHRGSCTLCV